MSSRPSIEQLLIRVLMRAVQELLRCLAELPEDAPERERAELELKLSFAPIWRRVPYVVLTCADDGLSWNDHRVLSPGEDLYRLAPTLVASGIHGITLIPGAEESEMSRFLQLIDRKCRLDEDGDQDLVLMLFRADLHHISYTVAPVLDSPVKSVDDGILRRISLTSVALDTEAIETTAIQPKALKTAVRADAATEDERRGVVQLEKFDSTLYFLDKREIEYLRTAIDAEYSRDHTLGVLALLFDILQAQSDSDVRDEVIGVLENLLPYLLGIGRFGSVAYLTGELRKITRDTKFEPAHKAALDELRVSVSEVATLTQLFHVLDHGDVRPTPEELGILLRELRPEAIQTVLVWIGQLGRPEAKTALVEAIDNFFTEWPGALSRMTTSSNRTAVHRALRIAHRLKLSEFAEPVGDCLGSDDPTTRRLAVRTLFSIGTSAAIRYLVRTVDDPDAEVRTVTYRSLRLRPYRGAQTALRDAIDSGNFESRDLTERKALFSAYGAVAGGAGVSTLQSILKGKRGIGGRPSSETRACAAVALGVADSASARSVLRGATKDRDPVVRSAANAALRSEGTNS